MPFFKQIFDHEPTREEIAERQAKLGYHPAGYGGPYGIRVSNVSVISFDETISDPRFEVSWSCSNSCD